MGKGQQQVPSSVSSTNPTRFFIHCTCVSNQLFRTSTHPYYSETTRRKPVVDVYWLADTGGALLLIAHLHTIWSKWNGNCSLRVFLHSSKALVVQTTAQVMRMIQKFRIPVSSVEPFDMYLKPSRKALRDSQRFSPLRHE